MKNTNKNEIFVINVKSSTPQSLQCFYRHF